MLNILLSSVFGIASIITVLLVIRDIRKRIYRVVIIFSVSMGSGLTVIFAMNSTTFWIALTSILASYLALSIAAAYDIKDRLIPNLIPILLLVIRILLLLCDVFFNEDVIPHLVSSVGGFIFSLALFAIAAKVTNGGIGSGDIKLISALGFACGLGFVLSVSVIALLVCAFVGGLLLLTKKLDRKTPLPFAPFIWCGFIVLITINAL